MLTLSMPLPAIQASEDSTPEGRRTIKGRAVPWETEALTSTGQKVTFAKGAVTMAGIPVVLHHLPDRPVGIVASETSADDGLDVEARISQVRDGDEALVLASDGVLRGWSVGVNPTEFEEREDGSLYVTASDADHLALVMRPAFKEAQVESVAASAATTEGGAVTETATRTEQPVAEAPAVVAAAPRTPTIQASLPSVGEWMQAVANKRRDPEKFSAVQAQIQAATGHILDANFDGWDDVPYVGSLIDLHQPAARPLGSTLGIRSAPSGVKSFLRPKVASHIANAVTAAEKSDVTDDGLAADTSDQVDMVFYKRAANVSAEAQAFSSPDVYALVARDLVRAYLLATEAHFVAAVEGGTYASSVTVAVDGADAIAKMANAINLLYSAVYMRPDTFIMAPDVWEKFVSFTAADGRQLFPYLSPSNAGGTSGVWDISIMGLRGIVVPTLTAGKAYLAVGEYIECYESSRVNMGPVSDPTVLGTAFGIGGAVGTYITEAAVAEVAVAAA